MRKIIKHIDKPLLVIAFILFAIGLVMIFSSSNVIAFMKNSANSYNYFMKQAIFLLASLVASCLLIRFTTKSYGPLSWLAVIVITAILFVLLIYGTIRNKAISWFDFGFFSIQPSEFAKLIIIIWMASYYDKNKDKLDRYTVSLFPLLIAGAIAVLIFLQPDFGTMMIFLAIVGFLFLATPIASEIKMRIVLLGIGAVFVFLFVMIGSGKEVLLERQLQRFNFQNPCSRYTEETGYQVCNGYIAINNGGAFGVGLGNSTQKYLYLPEPHTDSIFAIVIEELGCVFATGIIILYFLLLGRIVKIGRESYTNQGALMCYGVAVYIFMHIVINLGGLFGLLPLTGVPLPFMSYGGSYTMVLVFSLTVVERVHIETKLREEALAARKAKKLEKA